MAAKKNFVPTGIDPVDSPKRSTNSDKQIQTTTRIKTRKKKRNSLIKNVIVQVRLTEEEADFLDQAAKREGFGTRSIATRKALGDYFTKLGLY